MSRAQSIAAVLAVLCFAVPLAAQSFSHGQAAPATSVIESGPAAAFVTGATATNPATATELALPVGPAVQNLAVGVRSNTGQPTPAEPYRATTSHSTAMMVVGGAALIVGAVVGGQAGEIVMIAGGIVGLVGLWNHLQ